MKRRFGMLKKAVAVGCAMAMLGSVGVWADEPQSKLHTGNTISADTEKINLIKDYIRGEGTQTDSESPAENFEFTITPYHVWNTGTVNGTQSGQAYTKENMPMGFKVGGTELSIDASTRSVTFNIVTSQGDAGENKKSTELELPSYSSVGDFWYKIVEKKGTTTGVTYGTNSNKQEGQTEYSRTYYMHVQVVNGTGETTYYRSVTLHKDYPADNVTNTTYNSNYTYNENNKVDNIQNEYSAGTLKLKKIVEGNAGDKNKRFEFKVTFTRPNNEKINSNIYYKAATVANADTTTEVTIKGESQEGTTWDNGTVTETVYIKHDETVEFKNIPYGVTYTVVETAVEGYTTTENYVDSVEGKVTKKIDSKEENATFTNTKNTTIDIGVLLKNAPYIAMIVVVCAAGVVFVLRRRNAVED